jgi:hypothetical protein
MARINVEDSLWADPRLVRLSIMLGSQLTAVGAVVVGWRVAQKYWCPDRLPIPESVFLEAGLPEELVTAGMADRVKGGIRMRGCEEHFAWWFQKQKAGANGGKSSAKRPRDAKGRMLPKDSKRHPSDIQAETSHSQASSSSSSSSSSSVSTSISESKSKSEIQNTWAVEWTARLYEAYPKRDGSNRKKAAVAQLQKMLTSVEVAERMLVAIQKYKAHCDAKGETGTSFVKQFKTFLGEWEEWETLTPVKKGTVMAVTEWGSPNV